MTKRDVIRTLLEGGKPPYVPWSCGFTIEAKQKLIDHFKGSDIEERLQNHILILGNEIGFFKDLGNNLVQDVFGVVWDRSIDKDIGNVKGCVLPEPTLKDYKFPDPIDPRIFKDIPERISRYGDRFRVFAVGFSLYERAWTLRGMENLLMDMVLNPGFVHELLNSISGL
jgi:uroporphyrinogen decarboxylase